MSTTENNKLIAEFMGHDISHFYVFIPSNGVYKEVEMFWDHCCGRQNKYGNYKVMSVGQQIPFKSLWYHKSWDWLMPVVIKMVTMYHSQCMFEHPGYTNIDSKWKFHFEALNDCKCVTNGDGETMLESTYKAIVKFVKWYNENKND